MLAHSTPDGNYRKSLALEMLLDQREQIENLAHNLDAMTSRANFLERSLNELGYEINPESQYPEIRRIPDIEEE